MNVIAYKLYTSNHTFAEYTNDFVVVATCTVVYLTLADISRSATAGKPHKG